MNASRFGTIGRGLGNTALGLGGTVAGGGKNFVGGFAFYGTVAGGFRNTAGDLFSTVPGGQNNEAGGDYSFAAGTQATIPASAPGSFLWSDSTGPATLAEGAANQFIVASTGGIGLYTYKDFSHGCYIGGLSAAWTCTSDRATKADIAAIEPRDVLERLVGMPISKWRFRGEPETVRHVGPMAQDFRASFGLGYDDKGITGVDADGVALAAIQGLHQIVQEKDREIAELRNRITQMESLRGELAAMKAAVAELRNAHVLLGTR